MIDLTHLPNYWMKDAYSSPRIDLKAKYEPLIREVFDAMCQDDYFITEQLNTKNCVYIFRMVGESFIREYISYIENWDSFWYAFEASEDFIRELPNKNWRIISKWQTLSEKFIEEHKDEVDWDEISEHQKLSVEFCKKHKKEVNWSILEESQDWW